MSDFIGYVSEITTRAGTSKQGKPYTAYNVRFTTKEGEQKTVGWGFNPPAFQEGQWVKTTVEQNGQYLNYKGAPVEAKAGPAPTATPSGATGAGSTANSGGTSRDGYWAEKERRDIEYTQPRIQYQNSRTAAIEVARLLLDSDSLPVSGAKGKAGESKRFEQVLDFVNKLTVQFYYDVDTLRLLESVADAGDVEVAARGELPEEVEESQSDEAFAEDDDTNNWDTPF